MEEWEIAQLKSLETMNVYSNENTEMKLLNNNADIIALESPDAFGTSSGSIKWVNTAVTETNWKCWNPINIRLDAISHKLEQQVFVSASRRSFDLKASQKRLKKSSSTRYVVVVGEQTLFVSETVKGQPIGWSQLISTIARCFINILTRLEL